MAYIKLFTLLQVVAGIAWANLLAGGTATDQEALNCSPSFVADGILSGTAYYHSGGTQANNWLDV